MSCLGLYHIPSSLAYHVYFILCSIFLDVFGFRLSFIFLFILHPSCIIFYPCSYLLFFPFFLLIHLSIHDKKEEYTGEYTGVFRHFYMTHVHILRERNSTSCTFVGGKGHKGDAYIKEEKTSFLWENLVLSCSTLCLFSRCFIVLWVTFSINALLLSSYHVYVLDMHTSLCYCALLVACSNDHLFFYMIIAVISIWLFCVWSNCSYVLQHVYLIAIYLLHYTCLFITCFTLIV